MLFRSIKEMTRFMEKIVMRIAICTSLLFLLLGFVQAQNFSIALFNTSFVECETSYDDLEKLNIYKNGLTVKFSKDGQPFSGVAKTILKKHTGEVLEYVVSEMKEGYPTKSIYYFPDGTISREHHFLDGLHHGLQVRYFDNGQKYTEENYEKGQLHGTVRRWTKEGNIGREAHFQNGIPLFDKVYIKDDNC